MARFVWSTTHDDFSLDLKEIEKAIGKKTKAVLINSPNNPTGVIYDQESLEELGKIVKGEEPGDGKDALSHYR